MLHKTGSAVYLAWLAVHSNWKLGTGLMYEVRGLALRVFLKFYSYRVNTIPFAARPNPPQAELPDPTPCFDCV
jgi:hypothetical protein